MNEEVNDGEEGEGEREKGDVKGGREMGGVAVMSVMLLIRETVRFFVRVKVKRFFLQGLKDVYIRYEMFSNIVLSCPNPCSLILSYIRSIESSASYAVAGPDIGNTIAIHNIAIHNISRNFQ